MTYPCRGFCLFACFCCVYGCRSDYVCFPLRAVLVCGTEGFFTVEATFVWKTCVAAVVKFTVDKRPDANSTLCCLCMLYCWYANLRKLAFSYSVEGENPDNLEAVLSYSSPIKTSPATDHVTSDSVGTRVERMFVATPGFDKSSQNIIATSKHFVNILCSENDARRARRPSLQYQRADLKTDSRRP